MCRPHTGSVVLSALCGISDRVSGRYSRTFDPDLWLSPNNIKVLRFQDWFLEILQASDAAGCTCEHVGLHGLIVTVGIKTLWMGWRDNSDNKSVFKFERSCRGEKPMGTNVSQSISARQSRPQTQSRGFLASTRSSVQRKQSPGTLRPGHKLRDGIFLWHFVRLAAFVYACKLSLLISMHVVA